MNVAAATFIVDDFWTASVKSSNIRESTELDLDVCIWQAFSL